MASKKFGNSLFLTVLVGVVALSATAQSFRVQCPTSTITHPVAANNNAEPAYTGPTGFTNTNPSAPASGYLIPSANVNGAIKCQQISGGDGYSTMADGAQTFLFSLGPLLAWQMQQPAGHVPGSPTYSIQSYQPCSHHVYAAGDIIITGKRHL